MSASQNSTPEPRRAVGRRAVISREDLIQAAIRLTGPNRSISTLSLREITRQAGIAPNSFYRHFRDVDELAVALIEASGASLRQIIGQARKEANTGSSIVRSSIEVFMGQLHADEPYLPILLREGRVGSLAFKEAVEKQLRYFEDELETDLSRLSALSGVPLADPDLVSSAITRLVFGMGSVALDTPEDELPEFLERLVKMVRIILRGAQAVAREGWPKRDSGSAL